MASQNDDLTPKTAPSQEVITDDKPSHPVDGHGEIGERRMKHHDLPDHGHNISTQKSVDENPDLALHYSHEHQHMHLHHGRAALAGRADEVVFSDHTTVDKSNIPDVSDQNYVKHHMQHADHTPGYPDAEKGTVDPSRVDSSNSEDDGHKHRFSRKYSSYKIFVHIFIWLFFTA